jgi:hypothetical protein
MFGCRVEPSNPPPEEHHSDCGADADIKSQGLNEEVRGCHRHRRFISGDAAWMRCRSCGLRTMKPDRA